MVDKVQKIREKVERIQLYTQSEVLKQVLDYIDEVQKEHVSEDLEQAADGYSKVFSDIAALCIRKDAFIAGANWQKQQMMKDAYECEIKVDAGGYPYIQQIELYDYDKDIPLAKEGDKYKVVLIKEN